MGGTLVFVCDAHRHPSDEVLIRGTYQFAVWTLKHSGDGDIQTATCFHFYEHLPDEPLVRKQAPRFMFRSEVLGLSEIFTRRIGPEEFRKFLDEFKSQTIFCNLTAVSVILSS